MDVGAAFNQEPGDGGGAFVRGSMKRSPALRSSGIQVGATVEQEPDGSDVAVGRGPVERGRTFFVGPTFFVGLVGIGVGCVHVGAAFEQILEEFDFAHSDAPVEYRPTLLVGRVHLGAVVEQQRNDVAVLPFERETQRGVALGIGCAHVGAAIQQQLDEAGGYLVLCCGKW